MVVCLSKFVVAAAAVTVVSTGDANLAYIPDTLKKNKANSILLASCYKEKKRKKTPEEANLASTSTTHFKKTGEYRLTNFDLLPQ